ncbi:MAG: ABC transporter ATP-binding protein [Solirubrobacteraceae bacterium]
MILTVEGLSKVYEGSKSQTKAIERLDFAIDAGEFVSVVGPSGCGKTTLLKCLGGLLPPTSGRASLRGEPIVAPPRDMAIVFQDYARSLYPWFTVEQNVALPLRRKRKDSPAIGAAIEAVGLAEFANHYPWQLSGGMQQRVAIARAVAYQPQVMLLDEPFASVDAQTRTELEDLMLRVRDEYSITCLLVTHDVDEAVYMSDRVVMLTRQPSTILGELEIDLPRPRDQITTKALPAFAEYRAEIYSAVTRAHAPKTLVDA